MKIKVLTDKFNFSPSALLGFIILLGSGNLLLGQNSTELNMGSARPIGVYGENHKKQGMWDFGIEHQREISALSMGSDLSVSLGMKISYNYYLQEKENWDKEDLDSTFIQYSKADFVYKLRSHILSFHPCIEISTSPNNRFVAYLKYYVGPSYRFSTAYVKYELEDYEKIVSGWERRLVNNSDNWTLDQGLKAGIGYAVGGSNTTFLTFSCTYIWGGETTYIGDESVSYFDRDNPSNVQVNYVKSTTDRLIFNLGVKFFVGFSD